MGDTSASSARLFEAQLEVESVFEPVARRASQGSGELNAPPAAFATALRAQIREAQTNRGISTADAAHAEAFACARLSRHLLAQGERLDEAITLGRRALTLHVEKGAELADHRELRRALCSTLCALGEPGLAAALLRPLAEESCSVAAKTSSEVGEVEAAVTSLLELGDLLLRASDSDAAIELYREIGLVAPERHEGQERIARVHVFDPTVTADLSARAWIAAAKKHQIAGRDTQAFEGVTRAFDTAPHSTLAATVLSDLLNELNRQEAADAVRREHAAALPLAAAVLVHSVRADRGQLLGDRVMCLSATLDEAAARVTSSEPGSAERQLLSVGRVPMLAQTNIRIAAAMNAESRHLHLQSLANTARTPDEQLDIWLELLAYTPSDSRLLSQIRDLALTTGDIGRHLDGLVRSIVREPKGAVVAELAGFAQESALVFDPELACFAWEQLLTQHADDTRAQKERARLLVGADSVRGVLVTLEHAVQTGAELKPHDVDTLLVIGPGHPKRATLYIDVVHAECVGTDTTPARRSLDANSRHGLLRAIGILGVYESAHSPHVERALGLLDKDHPERRSHVRTLRVTAALANHEVPRARSLLESLAEPSELLAWLRVSLEIYSGDGSTFARAIERLPYSSVHERAAILACSAWCMRRVGDDAAAHRFAETGMRLDPRDVRCAVELAELAVDGKADLPPALAGAAIERALTGIGPRSRWLLCLAGNMDQAGDPAFAAVWTRRAWSLRIGDRGIATAWLRRVGALKDAGLLHEVIHSVATSSASLGTIADALAQALTQLASLGEDLARSSLELLRTLGGIRYTPLRSAMMTLTQGEPVVHLGLLEQWLASGARADERANLLLDGAEPLLAIKPSVALSLVVRALDEPLTPEARTRAELLLDRVAELDPTSMPLDGDGLLALSKLHADRTSHRLVLALRAARGRRDASFFSMLRTAADTHRLLGRDLWELAGDRDHALRIWLRGAVLLGREGLDRIDADIKSFAGADAASQALLELARRAESQHGWPLVPLVEQRTIAFRMRAWERLVESPPKWVDPVSLAKEAAASSSDPAAILPKVEHIVRASGPTILSEVFDIAAARTAGRYGERGVHYRAARTLEQMGACELAYRHATAAFSALPSQGALAVLLERTARESGHVDGAVATLMECAEQADPSRRGPLLERAGQLAATGIEDPNERLDVLIRVFLAAPSVRSGALLATALGQAVQGEPEMRATLVTRTLRAYARVETKLGYNSRLPVVVALAEAVAALGDVDSIHKALDLLAHALPNTPRPDHAPLYTAAEHVGQLGMAAAASWLDTTTGNDALRAYVAFGAGQSDRAVQILGDFASSDFGDVAANSEDLNLQSSPADTPHARELAALDRFSESATDRAALAAVYRQFGRQAGPEGELEVARRSAAEGNVEAATHALRAAWNARAYGDLATRSAILKDLAESLRAQGFYAELATLWVEDLRERDQVGVLDEDRASTWKQVAALRSEHLDDPQGALDALVEAGRLEPDNEDTWQEITTRAEALGAHDQLAMAYAQRLSFAEQRERAGMLRRLARVLELDLGHDQDASERWGELIALVPDDVEASEALERIAERLDDRPALLELLRARAARLPVGSPMRVQILTRLVRELSGQAGRRGEVVAALHEVHLGDPTDEATTQHLARLSVEASDFTTAADVLLRTARAMDATEPKLRFALGSVEAQVEMGDLDAAARTLREFTHLSPVGDVPQGSKDADTADPREVEFVSSRLRRIEQLAELQWKLALLRRDVSQRRGDVREEAQALVHVAELGIDRVTGLARAQDCAAAARALRQLGESIPARDLAWAAVRSASDNAEMVGLLAELEITDPQRQGGRPLAHDAELLALLSQFGPGHVAPTSTLAILAYSRAELLDTAQGGGAGYRHLNQWPEEVRAEPIVQLALAERLAAEWSFPAATQAYERALAGDIKMVRAVGPTALRASEVAARANDEVHARMFLDLAARDPACRVDARRRAVELARTLGDGAGALRALERLAAESTGVVRAQALADQARMLRTEDRERAIEAMSLAVSALDPASAVRAELMLELDELRTTREGELPPAPPPSLRDSGSIDSGMFRREDVMGMPAPNAVPETTTDPTLERQAERDVERAAAGSANNSQFTSHEDPPETGRVSRTSLTPKPAVVGSAIDLETLTRLAEDTGAPVAERTRAHRTLGEARHEAGENDPAIAHFIRALEMGDVTAGDLAAELLLLTPDREADLVLVRRRQAFLMPGDRSLLDGLYDATLRSRDLVFARAVDHVRRAFDPVAGPVPPPPLEAQFDRPELILPLLERRAVPTAAEALKILWDHASSLFRRELSTMGLGPLDRVAQTSGSIGKLVFACERILGSRVNTYAKPLPRNAERALRPDVDVVLTYPASVILTDCREDDPEVRFALGRALLAALPAHCLLLGQPEASARPVWQGLVAAFGPTEFGRHVDPNIGRLAAALWQSLPRAPQRRLGELLGNQPPTFESALEGARQVARRGGLYVSGDMTATVRAVLRELGGVEAPLAEPNGLAVICEEWPAIADLVRLATSPEYAEARWRTNVNPGSTARIPNASTFRE